MSTKPLRAQLIDHFAAQEFPEDTTAELMAFYDKCLADGCTEDESLAKLKKQFFKIPAEAKANFDYRKCLYNSIAKSGKVWKQSTVNDLFRQFDRVAGIKGEKDAFTIFHKTFCEHESEQQAFESYAASLDVRIESPTSKVLRESLESINRENSILTNPVDRLNRLSSQIKSNYAKLAGMQCSLTSTFTGGRELYLFDNEDWARIKRTIPNLESQKEREHVAYGSWKSNHLMTELEFE